MSKKLFIGNLSYSTTEESLRNKLEEFGTVVSVKIVTDRFSGRSRGFAFVEMETDEMGATVIEAMHEKEFEGRNLVVREDKPQPKRDRYEDRR
ncbi:MAG TPA: RNA-binding protein [Candidatus Dojkabacteria bacterium]|nr:RNA-binding protein [Candidatus Dojkabacteria bacterium]HQF36642.1 RNA-binding protein [Candidatus Dojkabacteria bacterium]